MNTCNSLWVISLVEIEHLHKSFNQTFARVSCFFFWLIKIKLVYRLLHIGSFYDFSITLRPLRFILDRLTLQPLWRQKIILNNKYFVVALDSR